MSTVRSLADIGVNPSRYLKLFSREIIFEVFQPIVITVPEVLIPERCRRTDRWTTLPWHNLALCSIAQ